MKPLWFKRKGILFIPKSFMGWAILLIGIIYAIYLFLDIDSTSHSVSDTVRPFFIYLFMIGSAYTLIAFLTSSSSTDTKNQKD